MLTHRTIRSAAPREHDYKLFDAQGLYLLVRPSSTRGWRFKYRIEGREKLLSFGPYPTVTLAKARKKCRAARGLLLEGLDPSVERQSKKARTSDSFEAVAREWFAGYSNRWSSSYPRTVIRRLEIHVFPHLGTRSIGSVRPSELLRCLKLIEERGTRETAHRVYDTCAWILRYATATNRRAHDPACLKGALLPTQEQHLATITDPMEFGGLLRAIEGYNGSAVVRAALRLAPLVFVRPSELRAAQWSEFKLDERMWIIPAERMKMRVEHFVPLSDQSIAILREIQGLSGGGRHVFPAPRSPVSPLSNVALLAALRRMGYESGRMTVHGFRASASTMLNEQGWRADVIERQLAHGERDPIRAAYNRAQYLAERTLMMQGWANYLDQLRSGLSR